MNDVALFTRNLRRQGLARLALLLLAGMGMALGFHQTRLDPQISARFFDAATQTWPWAARQPWAWLFDYGTIPGLVLTLFALGGWGLSHFSAAWAGYRRYWLLVFLTSIIGGGIIVNGLLKDYWGRPRPRETVEFGGHWKYLQVCEVGKAGRGKSFPCGHCTMGYLFTILLFFRKKNKWIAYLGGGFGLLYGILISLARVLQGAHFAQDTFFAAWVLWLVATLLAYFVLPLEAPVNLNPAKGWKRLFYGLGIGLAALAIAALFLTRRPYVRSYDLTTSWHKDTQAIYLRTNFGINQPLQVRFAEVDRITVYAEARGLGWPDVVHDFYVTDHWQRSEGRLILDLTIYRSGYFNELDHWLSLTLPKSAQGRVRIELEDEISLPPLEVRP